MATNQQNINPNVNFQTPSNSNLRGYLFLIIAIGFYGAVAFVLLEGTHGSVNLSILFYSIVGTFFLNLGFVTLSPGSLHQENKNRTEVQDAESQTLVYLTDYIQELQRYEEGRVAHLRQEIQSLYSSIGLLKNDIGFEEQRFMQGWQEQAESIIDEDPEAAVLMGWIGLEQEILNALKRLEYPTQRNGNTSAYLDRNLGYVIINSRVLLRYNFIDEETADEVVKMFNIRNQLIQGKQISMEAAVKFVQDAIRIARIISKLGKI